MIVGKMRKLGFFLLSFTMLFVLCGGVASAEPIVVWTKTYYTGGVAGGDYAHEVAVDSNDNVIVIGRSPSGYHIIKYDPFGNELWATDYNGWGYRDGALKITVDSNNNIIFTGGFFRDDFEDYITIKYDSEGNKIWEARYDSGGRDLPYGIAVDSNDNVIVSGKTNESCYTIMYDPEGNELWTNSYDIGSKGTVAGVAVDSNDNVIVAGYSNVDSKYFIIKYDSMGNEIWTVTPEDHVFREGIAIDSKDNIIKIGHLEWDYVTIKYNPEGNVVWKKTYDGGGNDLIKGVAFDSNDNVIVAGYSRSQDNKGIDSLTIKYDTNGNELWAMRFDNGSNGYALGIAVDSIDNIIIVGYIKPEGFDANSWYVAKYSEDINGSLPTTTPPPITTAPPTTTSAPTTTPPPITTAPPTTTSTPELQRLTEQVQNQTKMLEEQKKELEEQKKELEEQKNTIEKIMDMLLRILKFFRIG